MVDRPKKPFEQAARNSKTVPQVQPQTQPQNKRPEIIRDKDNAAPRPKPPRQSRYPAPNMAPPGMKGIQAKPQLPQQHLTPDKELTSIIKTHPKPELLTGGRFMDKQGHSFAVEVNPFRTYAGIENGKITTLEIQKEGKVIAQYKDMKWTKIPDKPEQQKLVQRLQDQFGEPRRDVIPIVSLSPDKDKGRNR